MASSMKYFSPQARAASYRREKNTLGFQKLIADGSELQYRHSEQIWRLQRNVSSLARKNNELERQIQDLTKRLRAYPPPPIPRRPDSPVLLSETVDEMEIDAAEAEEKEEETAAFTNATGERVAGKQVEIQSSETDREPRRPEPIAPPPPPPSSPEPSSNPSSEKRNNTLLLKQIGTPVKSPDIPESSTSSDKLSPPAEPTQSTEKLIRKKPTLELRRCVKTNTIRDAQQIASEIGVDLNVVGKKKVSRMRERVKEEGRKWREAIITSKKLAGMRGYECFELQWPLKEETDPDYIYEEKMRITVAGSSGDTNPTVTRSKPKVGPHLRKRVTFDLAPTRRSSRLRAHEGSDSTNRE